MAGSECRLGLDWAVQARLLSVIFALLGTVALDRLWGARFDERTRITLLALWTLSPCLLLYARMCRSYRCRRCWPFWRSALLVRVSGKGDAAERGAAGAGAARRAVHPLRGRNRSDRHRESGCWCIAGGGATALAIDCAIAIGYLPWIWRLAASLATWGSNARKLYVDRIARPGSPGEVRLLGDVLRHGRGGSGRGAACWARLLMPLVARGWSGEARAARRNWRGLAAALARHRLHRRGALGLLPVRPGAPALRAAVLPAAGGSRRGGPSLGQAGGRRACCCFRSRGIWCYFQKTGFRNKQYPMPIRRDRRARF